MEGMWLARYYDWKFNSENYMYLASTAGSSTSISSTYILFLTKLQKRQIPEKGSALIKKTILQLLNRLLGLQIY